MDDEVPDAVQYGLVMPFRCVQSNGGALDDHAFIAGCTFGQHDAELRSAPRATAWAAYVTPDMVEQYDLLAMHHGFTMKAEPWEDHPDDWVLVIFTKGEADDA